MGRLLNIKLSDIRENPDALRSVNKTRNDFIELTDSIRKQGVLNAILVREEKDAETGADFFALVDGLHRFTAAQEAGLQEIPAQVISMKEADVLVAQVMTNVHKIETKPAEYAKAIHRILSYNPTMTKAELADKLGKSPAWLNQVLGLLKLDEDIQKAVDDGQINVSNAYALSRLPTEEQKNYLDAARTQTPQEFVGVVSARHKELREAKKQGREAEAPKFVATPHMRKMSEINDARENASARNALIEGASSPAQAAQMVLDWAMHTDEKSVASARAKFEAGQKEKGEAKARRDAERAEKKAKDTAAEAAKLADDAAKKKAALPTG